MANAIFNAGWDTSLPSITTFEGDAEVTINVSAGFGTVTLTSFDGAVTKNDGTRCFIAAQHKLAVTILAVVGGNVQFAAATAGGTGDPTTEEEGEV